uniref:Letm1 RBD domain-containing protein n=1 Tax=Fagus sylvatica TaxID=28930 RepID=A0A2N9GNH2_FAGSY
MASRAILHRRRNLFNSLNQSTCLIRGFPSFEHGQTSPTNELLNSSWVANHAFAATDNKNEGGLSSVNKDGLPALLAAGFRRHNSVASPTLGYGIGRADFVPRFGVQWISQSIRYASTATAGQPDTAGGNDENEQKVAKKVKEASPEECDQAVEGLSNVKAKAKAKQMQESQKSAESIMKRVWAMLLGVGPALRAVASMSREDWAKKLRHWKGEFLSTLQHYWLGTKLLWADVRISSRLLVKLAKGKSLSRRERQQLTRTTADIFRLVPVAVFLIVPFMEFLLPVFLKLFPNMLPSTFQDKMKEQICLALLSLDLAPFLAPTNGAIPCSHKRHHPLLPNDASLCSHKWCHPLLPQTAPSPAPKCRQPLLPQVVPIWWLCGWVWQWVWWGLFVGLVEIFCGFDGEIMVDLQMFCGFDVEIMGICRCSADLMGLMALQMGGWGVGFVGGFKKEVKCKNGICKVSSGYSERNGERKSCTLEVGKLRRQRKIWMNLSMRRGGRVSNDEILGFAKLFNDELTLDNISRPRLVNMCKYMGISPYGTDAYLRFMLRKRLQEIKNDDKLIQAEGVESLSEAELRQACRDRGVLEFSSVEEMRQQLRDWLDLSLNHSLPSSLLILSRAFSVSGKRPEEVVQEAISSLPDEVVDTVQVTTMPSEDIVSERRRKLEFLEMQEELIKEEEEEEEEEQARMKESASSQKDVALEEMTTATAREAGEQARVKTMEKVEQLCELSRALAVLASASVRIGSN